MDIDRIIRNRRSTYTAQFSGRKIPDKVIERLLENANWAPNHYHTEPWRFIVYSDKGKDRLMDELARIYKEYANEGDFSQSKFDKYHLRKNQISHAIILSVTISNRPDLPEVEEICATACAVQNMWLTLSTVKGVGGYWSSGNLVYTPEFGEFAQLSENESCLGIFYLGMKKPQTAPIKGQRRPWQDKVRYIKN